MSERRTSNTGMDVSNEYVKEHFSIVMEMYGRETEAMIMLKREVEENRRIERGLIEARPSACSAPDIRSYAEHLRTLDARKIKQALGEDFYDVSVLDAVSCAVDSIFYPIDDDKRGFVVASDQVKELATNVKQFGSSSGAGFAMTGGFSGVKDLYVVKAPRKPKSDLLHELFVGLYGTNSLRKDIPSFSFIYGGFQCPPPSVDPSTGRVSEICPSSGDAFVPYVLYENVAPEVEDPTSGDIVRSKSIGKYVQEGTTKHFISAYLQVLLALHYAVEKIDFTHYDLHSENVIMRINSSRDVTAEFQIPFPYFSERGDEVPVYVRSDAVATIIDYGNSFVRYEGRPHGMYTTSLVKAGQYPDRSWPLYDAYKLLMFLLMDLADAVNALQKAGVKDPNHEKMKHLLFSLSVGERIFRWFNKTDTVEQVLNDQWENRFALPLDQYTSQFRLKDLINHVSGVWDEAVRDRETGEIMSNDRIIRDIPFEGLSILSCGSNPLYHFAETEGQSCSDFSSVTRSFGVRSMSARPSSIQDFYDRSPSVKQADPILHKQWKEDSETHEKLILRFENDTEKALEDMNALIGSVLVPNLAGMDIFTYGTMFKVRRHHHVLFRLSEILSRMTRNLHVAVEVGNEIDRRDVSEKAILFHREELAKAREIICQLLWMASRNYNIIKCAIDGDRRAFAAAVEKDPRLAWYETEALNILGLQQRSCDRPYKLLSCDSQLRPVEEERAPSAPFRYRKDAVSYEETRRSHPDLFDGRDYDVNTEETGGNSASLNRSPAALDDFIERGISTQQ